MNKELLIKVRDTIKTLPHFRSLAHKHTYKDDTTIPDMPELFSMDRFHGGCSGCKENDCGTAGCVVGVVIGVSNVDSPMSYQGYFNTAKELLDIGTKMAYILFYASGVDTPLRKITPEMAVKAIDKILDGQTKKKKIWAYAIKELADE